MILAGDFNARVGNQPSTGFIDPEKDPGIFQTDFCWFDKLKVTNILRSH
jgi:hypothetical protein